MANSPLIDLVLLAEAQEQSEVTVNQNYNKMEMLSVGVIDRDLSAPPGSPSEGDLYIVGPTATGLWTGQENARAGFYDGWLFIPATEGQKTWINDEAINAFFNGTVWAAIP